MIKRRSNLKAPPAYPLWRYGRCSRHALVLFWRRLAPPGPAAGAGVTAVSACLQVRAESARTFLPLACALASAFSVRSCSCRACVPPRQAKHRVYSTDQAAAGGAGAHLDATEHEVARSVGIRFVVCQEVLRMQAGPVGPSRRTGCVAGGWTSGPVPAISGLPSTPVSFQSPDSAGRPRPPSAKLHARRRSALLSGRRAPPHPNQATCLLSPTGWSIGYMWPRWESATPPRPMPCTKI